LIVINPTYGSFVGRSDPTALCFGFLAAGVMLASLSDRDSRIYAFGLVGLLLGLMILTNWRFIAVVPFMLVAWWGYGGRIRRPKLNNYVACFVGLILPLLFVLHHYYAWDVGLYYKHYFGFFGPNSGWGHSFSDVIHDFSNTTDKLLHLNLSKYLYLLVGSVILSSILFAISAIEGQHRRQWCFCILLLLAAVLVHYIVTAVGDFYYIKPFLIVVWMCGITLCAQVNTLKFPTLGLISIVIIFVTIMPPVASQHLFFARSFSKAMEFAETVKRAEAKGPIYSESHFFFLRSRIPLVDMGDTVSKVEKTGYYGQSFSALFRENLNRLALMPPTHVIHSFIVDSPELAAIVRSQYSEYQCAPRYFAGYFPPPCLYQLAVQPR
jgi:hypothetical protein